MKAKFAISLFVLLSLSMRAGACPNDFLVGYVCEPIHGQYVLTQNSRGRDHGADVCETMTLENFGSSQKNCHRAASVLNGRGIRRYDSAPLLQTFTRCGDYRLKADDQRRLVFINDGVVDYPASHQMLTSSEYQVDLHEYSVVLPQGRIEFVARTTLSEERDRVISVTYSAGVKNGSQVLSLRCQP